MHLPSSLKGMGSKQSAADAMPMPIQAVIVDTNALMSGNLDLAKLEGIAERLAPRGIPVWVPFQVVAEWAVHAAETVQRWKEASRAAGRLAAAGVENVGTPDVPDWLNGATAQAARQLRTRFRSAIAALDNVEVLEARGDSALAAIDDQILGTGPGRKEGGVRTGAADSALVRDAVAHAARAKRSGVLVFLSANKKDILATLDALGISHDRYVIGAGLPNLPAVLAESRSYAERLFFYSSIGALDPDAARAALVDPAATVGGRFLPDALHMLLTATEGYPYFLQEFGSAMWEVTAAAPFTAEDAAAAIEVGTAHLDQGFFPSRWDRATPAERRYLRAIADTAQPSPKTADLSIPQSTAGPLRAALIRKGIVYSPEHGRIAFTVPGMANFIARQPHNDE